jgi:hypothetical protein
MNNRTKIIIAVVSLLLVGTLFVVFSNIEPEPITEPAPIIPEPEVIISKRHPAFLQLSVTLSKGEQLRLIRLVPAPPIYCSSAVYTAAMSGTVFSWLTKWQTT